MFSSLYFPIHCKLFIRSVYLFYIACLLCRFSHVRFCATPWTAAYQASPSMGFSRQEHWSGLPFPSPMHENEKWKWSRSVVSDSVRPHGLQPTRLLRPWDFPGKSTGVGCHCLLQSLEILIQLAWSGYFLKGPIVVLIHSCVENHWSGLELDYQKI